MGAGGGLEPWSEGPADVTAWELATRPIGGEDPSPSKVRIEGITSCGSQATLALPSPTLDRIDEGAVSRGKTMRGIEMREQVVQILSTESGRKRALQIFDDNVLASSSRASKESKRKTLRRSISCMVRRRTILTKLQMQSPHPRNVRP